MVDFASLVLGLDSRQVSVGIKELDKLKASAGGAEKAATSLGQSFKNGTKEQQSFAKEQAAVLKQYETMIGKSYLLSQGRAREAAQFMALRKANTTADTEYGKTVAHLSGQLYDLDQQQNKTDKSANNFANTITRRLVFGFVVSQIKNLATNVIALNRELAHTGDLGRLTGLGGAMTQGLQSAAATKGIARDTFASSMAAFNQQIPLAKAGIGSLGELLRGNKITVNSTSDAFFKIADLVASTTDETKKISILQQAQLPATQQMANYMSQGADALKRQAAIAPKFTEDQLRAAKELDEKFNAAWESIEHAGKEAVVGLAEFPKEGTPLAEFMKAARGDTKWSITVDLRPEPGSVLDTIWKSMGGGSSSASGPVSPLQGVPVGAVTQGGPLPPAVPGRPEPIDVAKVKAEQQNRISREQALLSVYGATTTAMEARRVVELQLMTLANDHNGVSKERAETLKRLAEEQNLGITAMKSSADAARVEAETIGMSVGRAQEYVAVQTKLNEARRNSAPLTAEHEAAIRNEARAMGEAAESLDRQKWAFANLVQGPMQSFRSSIASGATAMDALKSTGLSALDRISQKLMDMAANNLWEAAMGGKSGGGGLFSIIGSLFGGGGGFGAASSAAIYAKGGVPSASSDISRYSNQIVSKPTFFAKGGNVMGEAGPEAVMPLVRTPDGNLGVRSQGGTGQAPVQVNITQHNDFRGADPGSEARLRREIAESKNQAVSEATQAVQKLHMNAPGQYLPRGR